MNAFENSRLYKEKAKAYHDKHLEQSKHFKEGDQVLLFNSRLKLFPRKLKSRWSGPFTVMQMFPYGIVEITPKRRARLRLMGIDGNSPLKVTQGLIVF